jgi:hypothetical protein
VALITNDSFFLSLATNISLRGNRLNRGSKEDRRKGEREEISRGPSENNKLLNFQTKQNYEQPKSFVGGSGGSVFHYSLTLSERGEEG